MRPWNVRVEMTMHGLFYVLWSPDLSGSSREQVREFKDFPEAREFALNKMKAYTTSAINHSQHH